MRVYINMRDLLTWPRAMADHLAARGHEVVFVDNDSSYPPLLRYYASCPHRVVSLGVNVGAKGPWLAPGIAFEKEPFVITDPDLDISRVPDDWPDVLQRGLDTWKQSKCGFGLEDWRVPKANPAYELDEFGDNGNPKYWNKIAESNGVEYFNYPIDTTFALYLPNRRYHINGIRTGMPYVARHLPFHIVNKVDPEDLRSIQIPMDDELLYYFDHAKSNAFGTYSTTLSRMTDIIEEYRRSSNAGRPPD